MKYVFLFRFKNSYNFIFTENLPSEKEVIFFSFFWGFPQRKIIKNVFFRYDDLFYIFPIPVQKLAKYLKKEKNPEKRKNLKLSIKKIVRIVVCLSYLKKIKLFLIFWAAQERELQSEERRKKTENKEKTLKSEERKAVKEGKKPFFLKKCKPPP